MYLKLAPIDESENSTVSSLSSPFHNKFLAFVIEDGKREKKVHGETRIPAGTYEIKKRFAGRHFEQYSKRFGHKHTFQIMNVPGFSYIMIHIGNTVKDTEGCLLLNNGMAFDKKTKNFIGSGSTACYKHFYDYLTPIIERESVFITIERF